MTTTCAHHWLIDDSHGQTSHGECKLCGESREFENSPADVDQDWREARIRYWREAHPHVKPEKEEQMPKTMDHPAVQAKGKANAAIRAEAKELLAGGATVADVAERFPGVPRETIRTWRNRAGKYQTLAEKVAAMPEPERPTPRRRKATSHDETQRPQESDDQKGASSHAGATELPAGSSEYAVKVDVHIHDTRGLPPLLKELLVLMPGVGDARHSRWLDAWDTAYRLIHAETWE